MADKTAAFDIDLGGFTSSDDDDAEEKKIDVVSSTPQSLTSRSSRSSHSNVNASTKSKSSVLVNGVHQLNAFYSGKSRENTPSTSHEEGRYDFKSKHFSAQQFVDKKVSDMTVSELANYSLDLNHGVKALDSEMQMMVYDNYNKFISATDTIRKMKDQVQNMENEMSKLLSNISNIATECSQIENNLSSNRCEIEKLVSVRGLLKKLEFLFELPNRLKKNIELGDYARAVQYFHMAETILIKYKHIKSFNRISIESRGIIDDLRSNLKKEMISANIMSSKQLEIAKLLLSLNEEPELLWYDIFKTRKQCLLSCIITLKNCDEIKQYYDENNDNTSDFSVIAYFGIHFLSLFMEFVNEYKSVFDAIHNEKCSAALTSFTRDIFSEYFVVIRSELNREYNIDKLQSELKLFYDGLYKPSASVPSAKLMDRGTEIIEHCIRRSMEREFVSTQQNQLVFLMDYMDSTYDDEKEAKDDEYHIKKCVNKVKMFAIDCLNRLVPLTTNQSQLMNVLDLNFDDQLWSYTANIFKIFFDIIPCEFRVNETMPINDEFDHNHNHEFNHKIYNDLYFKLEAHKLLILSKILIGIKTNVVQEIIKHFKKNYLYKTSQGIYKQELLLFQKYCHECASGLRLIYTHRISQGIIQLINANGGMEKHKIEIEIGNDCIARLRGIYNVSHQLIAYHIIQHDTPHKAGSDREYDKLFNEESLIYDQVEDNANSVLFTVYKIVFKYCSEILRTKMINTNQQTQIHENVTFMRNSIPKIISKKDFKKLQTLLDEINQSAKERCMVVNNDTSHTIDID